MTTKTHAVYNSGSGMFESGIPARNLTEDEWSAIPADVQKRLLETGVYILADKKQETKKKDGE